MQQRRKQMKRGFGPRQVLYGSAAAAVGVVVFIMATASAPDLDTNGCSASHPLPKALLFYVDRTAPLTAHQAEAVRDLIDMRVAEAEAGEHITVFSLDSRWNGIAKPLFEICRPPRQTAETHSGATQTYLDHQWSQFQSKIHGFAENLTQTTTAQTSPIFESLRALTLTKQFKSATVRRDLVVLTDGLENTAAWPEARNARVPYAALGNSQFPKSVEIDLHSTKVSLYWLQRTEPEGHLQTPQQQALMADWLTAKGASMASPDTLPL